MASTYVNDLRLNEMATGDASGTWGTITNTNLELIGEALGYATQDCFASDADATTTVADGATDPARAMYFKVTSSATLTATRTLTIAPNTVSRLQFIENATTGSQSINISQGSGANVTIPSGQTKAVYFDGAGSGAAVTDSFASLNLNLKDNVKLNFGDADDLQIYHNGTDSKIYDGGTGNLTLESNGTQIELKSTTGDMVRAVKDDEVVLFYSGSRKLATTNTGIEVTGNIANASGDLTLDVAGDFTLDVGGGDIAIKDDGTEFGRMVNSSTDFVIQSSVNDRDLIFKGKDNNAVITALTLDMSDAGSAYFNNNLYIPNYIYHTGDTNTYIHFPAGDNFQVVTAGFSRMKMVGSETVFNEDSSNIDFRVESDLTTHAFFVDASNGNVLIKGSDSSVANTGFAYEYASDYIKQTSVSGPCLYLNRRTTDGTIQEFRKDNVAVGRIGTNGGRPFFINPTYGGLKIGTGYSVDPATTAGAGWDNSVDLGAGGTRWKDLYLSGTIEIEQGTGNVAVGKDALSVNTGTNNLAVGVDALDSNGAGSNNVALGIGAGNSNVSGSDNTFVGRLSGNASNTTGDVRNTFVGYLTGYGVTSGTANTFIGAGPNGGSGETITSGSKNSILGAFNGNQGGLDIRTTNNNIVLSDGDGNPRGIFNSSGNFGIGISPTVKLHLYETNAGPVQIFENSDTDTTLDDELGVIQFKGNDSSSGADGVRAFISGTVQNTSGGTQLRFGTANSLQTVTERMRIKADGTLLYGDPTGTAPGSFCDFVFPDNQARAVMTIKHDGATATNQFGVFMELSNDPNDTTRYFMLFRGGATERARIQSNGDMANVNNSFGALSDEKLKEQIVDASSQWDDIKALRVRKYKLKQDVANGDSDEHWRLGVVAQEVEASGMGGLVSSTTDTSKDEEGRIIELDTTTKQVKYSVLYMKAVKALQEAMTRIETLEAKVTALENA